MLVFDNFSFRKPPESVIVNCDKRSDIFQTQFLDDSFHLTFFLECPRGDIFFIADQPQKRLATAANFTRVPAGILRQTEEQLPSVRKARWKPSVSQVATVKRKVLLKPGS